MNWNDVRPHLAQYLEVRGDLHRQCGIDFFCRLNTFSTILLAAIPGSSSSCYYIALDLRVEKWDQEIHSFGWALGRKEKKKGWWDTGHGKTVLNRNINVCLSPPFGKTFAVFLPLCCLLIRL